MIMMTEGGIASSYSTLLILRELMTAIGKVEGGQSESENSGRPADSPAVMSRTLPCHYFDHIAGSSFGGWESYIHRSITALTTS